MTPTHDPRLNPTDLAVLRVINTGPVTLRYIQRILRLPRPPFGSITQLRRCGFLKPHEPGTTGYYLTGEGHRELLRSPSAQ